MAIKLSGLYYTNKMAYIYTRAIEDTIGPEAMKSVFELAGISELYPPPNNLAKAFDFAHNSAINAALEQMYGLRGARGLMRHGGRASFAKGLAEFGNLIGVGDLAFKALPLKAKLKIGLTGMAETFSKFSDQHTTVEDEGDILIYTIHACPVCWGRKSSGPICYAAAGIIEEGLQWVSGGQSIPIEEVTCRAAGDRACVFHIRKEPKSSK